MDLNEYIEMMQTKHNSIRHTSCSSIARAVGVTTQYMTLVKNKRTAPSRKVALKIEAATNGYVTAESLLDYWLDKEHEKMTQKNPSPHN